MGVGVAVEAREDGSGISSGRIADKRGVFGWMLFDWAAQPFFTVITTFVFGPYFVSQLGSDPVSGQVAWAHAATLAGIVIAIFAPLAGGLADAAGGNKRFIGTLAVIQVFSLSMLWFAVPGSGYFWPAFFIILATFAAEISVVFNDAMLPRLVKAEALSRISNDAWGLGYLGGMIVLIPFILLMAANPATGLTVLGHTPLFGLDPAEGEAARLSGPLSAIWYLVFLLPLFFFTPDTPRTKAVGQAARGGLSDLKQTLLVLKDRPLLLRFLVARMLYMDGLNGLLVLGGAFAAATFGWSTMEIGLFGIVLNIAAIIGCFAVARVSHLVGPGVLIACALVMLILATVLMVSTGPDAILFGLVPMASGKAGLFADGAEKASMFYGVIIGLAFGPAQAASRAFLAKHVQSDESGRFFGLYALTGRMTSFLATGAFALVVSWTGSPNMGMASLLIFLVSGLFLFLRGLKAPEQT